MNGTNSIAMSPAAKSICYFGVYLMLAGLALFISPNSVLALLEIQATTEIWIHLVGSLTFILGIFFLYMARKEVRPFFYISLFGRGTFIISIFILVLFYDAPVTLMLFGLVDLAGLLWTLFVYDKSN